MLSKGITLRGLEVFEALARTGSVAGAADLTGLSQPSVSQQLRNLEQALGIDLVDHSRRPMQLTAAGHGFLKRSQAALSELRLAQSELAVLDLTHLETLSIGLIDDFDNNLTPRLVTILANSLTGCRFKMITAPSLEISAAMRARKFHLAVAAKTGEPMDGIAEYPLVRDPFLLVAPKGVFANAQDALSQEQGLPLLRYEPGQLIARQIDAHLTRCGLTFGERFEIGSHLALMAMVTRHVGWAITTPLGYMRAVRYHDELDAFPLPFADFYRTISLFADANWSRDVPLDVAETMRRLIRSQMVEPAVDRLPWLNDGLRILDA